MGILFRREKTTVNWTSVVERSNKNQMIREIATSDFPTINSGRWFDQRVIRVVIPSHLLIPWLNKCFSSESNVFILIMYIILL